MKRLIIVSILMVLPMFSFASGGSIDLKKSGYDIHNKDSLRKGFDIYMAKCASCHSARFMRFERIAQDLEIDDMESKLPYGTKKLSATIPAAMTAEMGETAFGVAPPDLTLYTNYRSSDWVYTYLVSFYQDSNSKTGFNNHLVPNVAMPWVLAGDQMTKTEGEFRTDMRDLTNFMTYMAEPIRPFREGLLKYVMAFLSVLLVVVWLLNREYWKDIH